MAPDVMAVFGDAVAFHQAGQLEEAEPRYRRVLQDYPQHFDSLHLLGVIRYQQGQLQEALRQIDAALKVNPNAPGAHNNRGSVLNDLGLAQEALASYDRAIALKGDYADAFYNRGNVLRALGRPEEAVASYEQAVALRPDYAEAYNNLGTALKRLKRFDEALAHFDKALFLKPHYAEAWHNRANTLTELKRYSAALDSCDRAIALRPDLAEAYNNRGNALKQLRRLEEAIQSYDQALALRPNYTDAMNNRGSTLMEFGHLDEALSDFASAIALSPDHAGARWNRALCNLLMGRYRDAWIDYDQRVDAGVVVPRWHDCGRPQWTGGDVVGKTVLLHSEQGFGDTIMMARYLPRVIAAGAKVIVEAPAALASLIDQIEGVRIVTPDQTVPAFDLHCPMMSLPRAFGTTLNTIPSDFPYLRAPPTHLAKWRERLSGCGTRRVGIAWFGSPVHERDEIRSISPALLSPLFKCPDIEFISLQRDVRSGDAELLQRQFRITHLGADIESFADTAAIITLLDLIISVDTSAVHLAGALGKPVWVLVQFAPDWRWLVNRADSPWYPTARLFRQQRLDDWPGVIDRVAAELSRISL